MVKSVRSFFRNPMIAAVFLLAATTNADDRWPTERWPTGTPASVGLDARALAEFDADIAAGKYGSVDSMLVIRRGRIAWDRTYRRDYASAAGPAVKRSDPLILHDPSGPYNYLNPWWHPYYRGGDLHTLQSATKTVLSATIGAALARKEFPGIETAVLGYFDEARTANVDDRKRRITVRHLLTMTPGIRWQEDLPFSDPNNSAHAMEATCDWARFTIDQPMQHEPGAVFHYSSGASQLLSYVFQRATGRDVEAYAVRHLFTPLGIRDYFWKRTPDGLANTEGGLYMRPHDLAKIGYLYLRNGVWDGKRIIAEDWVKASITPAATVSESTGVTYGYQWWLIPHGDKSRRAWAALGWGGQMLLVVPERDLVLVFTGWNIHEEASRLRPSVALERILGAVK